MENMKSLIVKYFHDTLRYPLMVVVPAQHYKDLLKAFPNVPRIKVSSYCIDIDKDPDLYRLYEDIKNAKGRNILVGLGEYLVSRNKDAKNVLSAVVNIAFKWQKAKLAILLPPHMFHAVKEMHAHDPRIRMRLHFSEDAPVIKQENNSAMVHGLKAYLEACEKGDSIGSVKSAREIDFVNVIRPENAFAELKFRFPSEFSKLTQTAGNSYQWIRLLDDLNKEKVSIRQYIYEKGFDRNIDYSLTYYAKKNSYTAWLYFINLKLNMVKGSYIGLVSSQARTLDSLFEDTKNAILSINVDDPYFRQYYDQRKAILKDCSDIDMLDFIQKVSVLGRDRIAYLTDNTKIERQKIIEFLCEGASEKYIPESYPDLYMYLKDFPLEDERFTDYFSMYKKCKIKNKVNHRFMDIVKEFAKSRPYNMLPSRSSILTSLDHENTLLIFLDALGVEYLGYIKEKCSELKLCFSAKVTRAELPTTTSVNRAFFDEWRGKKETPIKDLDELKHNPERSYDFNNSPYPIHLVEELYVITNALERAKTKLQTGECQKVIIASDHGASRLAVISPGKNVSHNCLAKASGRYCRGGDLPIADNIVTETESEYAVIADYSRFIGSRAASVEIHGGATLEEVLVPVIELTLHNALFEVALTSSIIELGYKTIPTLDIKISPDCENISVIICNARYESMKIKKGTFRLSFPDLKRGHYSMEIFEGQNKIAVREFAIKNKGLVERDLF